MTAIARFRVATRATGTRRTATVFVYATTADLRIAANRFSLHHAEPPWAPETHDDTDGCCQIAGYRWPQPERTHLAVIRLAVGHLGTGLIAHEATHAAAEFTFADTVPDWDAPAREHLHGANEPLAYAAGHLTAGIVVGLRRRGLVP